MLNMDERIGRFLDGEMTRAESAAFMAEVEHDAALRARLDLLSGADQQARRLFDAQLAAPVPDALASAVRRAGRASPASRAGTPEHGPLRRAWASLTGMLTRPIPAAALAGLLMLTVGILIGQRGPDGGAGTPWLATGGMVAPASVLHTQLNNAPSGERHISGDDEIEILASFTGTDGRFCREYHAEKRTRATRYMTGLACRQADGDWTIVVAVNESVGQPAAGDAYVTASDHTIEAIDDFIRNNIGTAPLSAEQERAMLNTLATGRP